MKAVACLSFVWPYDQLKYPALCAHSICHLGLGKGDTLWVINTSQKEAVEAILGVPLLLEGEPWYTPHFKTCPW